MINTTAYLPYIYSLLLGLLSYLICLYWLGRKPPVPLTEYLYLGNSVFFSAASTIGTVFSVAILFTAVTAVNIIYGYIVYPVALVAILLGLIILKNRVCSICDLPLDTKINNSALCYVNRFLSLLPSRQSRISYFIVAFIYLILMLITEIGAMKGIYKAIVGDSLWGSLTVYIVFFISLAYVMVGGFKGVMVTDSMQAFLIISLFVLYLITREHKSVEVSSTVIINHFTMKGSLDIISCIIGGFILCMCWFSSAPELMKRQLTLLSKKQMSTSINITMVALPIVILLPTIVIILEGFFPTGEVDHTAAYQLWYKLFVSQGFFAKTILLCLIVTAYFTTLDTFILTISQVHHLLLLSVNNHYLEVILPKKPRTLAFFISILCLAIGSHLPLKLNAILGVYAACLTIPLFSLLHIHPLLTNRRRDNPISIWFYLAPLLFAYPIVSIALVMLNRGIPSYS